MVYTAPSGQVVYTQSEWAKAKASGEKIPTAMVVVPDTYAVGKPTSKAPTYSKSEWEAKGKPEDVYVQTQKGEVPELASKTITEYRYGGQVFATESAAKEAKRVTELRATFEKGKEGLPISESIIKEKPLPVSKVPSPFQTEAQRIQAARTGVSQAPPKSVMGVDVGYITETARAQAKEPVITISPPLEQFKVHMTERQPYVPKGLLLTPIETALVTGRQYKTSPTTTGIVLRASDIMAERAVKKYRAGDIIGYGTDIVQAAGYEFTAGLFESYIEAPIKFGVKTGLQLTKPFAITPFTAIGQQLGEKFVESWVLPSEMNMKRGVFEAGKRTGEAVLAAELVYGGVMFARDVPQYASQMSEFLSPFTQKVGMAYTKARLKVDVVGRELKNFFTVKPKIKFAKQPSKISQVEFKYFFSPDEVGFAQVKVAELGEAGGGIFKKQLVRTKKGMFEQTMVKGVGDEAAKVSYKFITDIDDFDIKPFDFKQKKPAAKFEKLTFDEQIASGKLQRDLQLDKLKLETEILTKREQDILFKEMTAKDIFPELQKRRATELKIVDTSLADEAIGMEVGASVKQLLKKPIILEQQRLQKLENKRMILERIKVARDTFEFSKQVESAQKIPRARQKSLLMLEPKQQVKVVPKIKPEITPKVKQKQMFDLTTTADVYVIPTQKAKTMTSFIQPYKTQKIVPIPYFKQKVETQEQIISYKVVSREKPKVQQMIKQRQMVMTQPIPIERQRQKSQLQVFKIETPIQNEKQKQRQKEILGDITLEGLKPLEKERLKDLTKEMEKQEFIFEETQKLKFDLEPPQREKPKTERRLPIPFTFKEERAKVIIRPKKMFMQEKVPARYQAGWAEKLLGIKGKKPTKSLFTMLERRPVEEKKKKKKKGGKRR